MVDSQDNSKIKKAVDSQQRVGAVVGEDSSTFFDYISSLHCWLFFGLALTGLALLIFAATTDWFSVPVAQCANTVVTGASNSGALIVPIVDAVPGCTRFFQATMLIGAFGIVMTWLYRRRWTLLGTFIAGCTCLTALGYPYAVMVHSPDIAAEANWLQMQHNNLTWLGGDIYANAQYAHQGWDSKTYFVDIPRQLNVSQLPTWTPWEFGLQHVSELVAWLGYTNTFCQFARQGWTLAVVGSVLLLLASLTRTPLRMRQPVDLQPIELESFKPTDGRIGQVGYQPLRRATIVLMPLCVIAMFGVLTAWSLPFRALGALQLAEQSCRQQRYADSRMHLQRAVDLLPTIAHDTRYIFQRGVLDSRLKGDSAYGRLHAARALESLGRYDQAFHLFQAFFRAGNEHPPAVERAALRAVLRYAIADYNSARLERSAQRFNFVLQRSPADVKLIYMMQLQSIRESRLEQVRGLRDQMYAASRRFNFGTKKVIRAAAQQHVVTATGLTHNAAAIWEAQAQAKRP